MEMLNFKIYGEICKKCQIYCSRYLMQHVKEGRRAGLGMAAAMQENIQVLPIFLKSEDFSTWRSCVSFVWPGDIDP